MNELFQSFLDYGALGIIVILLILFVRKLYDDLSICQCARTEEAKECLVMLEKFEGVLKNLISALKNNKHNNSNGGNI